MVNDAERCPAGDPDPLEFEKRLVQEAVRMVASGAARRVVLAGLRFSNDLLGPAGEAALEPGVQLMPLWRADEAGVDIAVEMASGRGSWPDSLLATGMREVQR